MFEPIDVRKINNKYISLFRSKKALNGVNLFAVVVYNDYKIQENVYYGNKDQILRVIDNIDRRTVKNKLNIMN